jgi:hypothetical protein
MRLKTFEHPLFLTCDLHVLEMMVQIVAGKLDKTVHTIASNIVASQARKRD